MSTVQHIGLSLGRIQHWHDGLGEFSRQLVRELAAQAPRLREQFGWELHLHLPRRWHGEFGDDVRYLDTHTAQRWLHCQKTKFSLWHTLHQHIRYKPPIGTVNRLLTIHDLNFIYFKTAPKAKKHLRRTKALVNRQTALVAISQHVRDDVSRHIDSTLAAKVIYNGSTNLSQAPQEAPVGHPEPGFLLHISRLSASKNVGCLLDLAAAMPQHVFVFAGPHSRDSQAFTQAINSRALHNVRIFESVPEAQKSWLYAHCNGFLFPSLTEGFGLPPLEAMHFGKPVFLSRLTSLPEVGGKHAFYLDTFDASSMRAVVLAGLEATAQGQLAAVIAEHARAFSWEKCAQRYIDTYFHLLRQPH